MHERELAWAAVIRDVHVYHLTEGTTPKPCMRATIRPFGWSSAARSEAQRWMTRGNSGRRIRLLWPRLRKLCSIGQARRPTRANPPIALPAALRRGDQLKRKSARKQLRKRLYSSYNPTGELIQCREHKRRRALLSPPSERVPILADSCDRWTRNVTRLLSRSVEFLGQCC